MRFTCSLAQTLVLGTTLVLAAGCSDARNPVAPTGPRAVVPIDPCDDPEAISCGGGGGGGGGGTGGGSSYSCPGSYYSANASISPYCTGGPFGGFQSTSGTGYQSSITIWLTYAASAVTATVLDPDYSGNYMAAYNSAGSEVGRVYFDYDGTPGSFTSSTKTVTGSGIVRVVLVNDASDYVAWDKVHTLDPYVTGGPFGGFQSASGTGYQTPITVRFTHPQSSVTVTALDPDYSGNYIAAQNGSGSELTRSYFAYDNAPGSFTSSTRTVSYSGSILNVALVNDPNDYVAYSGLSFNP